MTSALCIVACHSDEALQAEISFWAASVDCRFVKAGNARALRDHLDATAIILELSEQGESDLDTLQQIAGDAKGKIIAVTTLDAKTVSSIRRLLEAKALNVIVLSRADFSTRMLADLLSVKKPPAELDRETLAGAIRDGLIIAHYQPKVPFQPENENFGVEALCRIEHPVLGMLYPDSFIPLAEAHDLILDLTDAVTVHAFRSLATWDKAGLKLRLAINISPRLMSDTVWFERFQERCQQFSIDPCRITLEVTESSSQGGKVLALEILSRLRLKGFLLSIDDFGTGFSSLETLYKLPFGELKIDKGFVFDLQKSNEARALVESTIMLARKLGLKICAEGVESQQLFDELRLLQCDDAQGYHISKPLPASNIVTFFNEWSAKQREAVAKNPHPSKFSSVYALLADLLSDEDDNDDSTIVLSSPALKGEVSQETAREIAARIPALVLGGDMLTALEQIHRAIRCTGNHGSEAEFRRKLQTIQVELESALAPTSALALHGSDRTVHLHGGRSFTVGRHSANYSADISVVCRWMSRGEKNLRVFAQGSAWYLEDLGSTNGHFLDGRRLTPFKSHRLADGETLIEIGKSGNAAAPAWLRFRLSAEGALHLSFGIHDQADLAANANSCTDWILFDAEFSLGRSPSAALPIPECGAEIEADISLRNGNVWITPRSGVTIWLGEAEFSQSVPLVPGCTLAVGNSRWAVEELAAPETVSTALSASA
jgi:EAL domain-containing protein (putative c-di-GMP-specific phosphodiesterase class I)